MPCSGSANGRSFYNRQHEVTGRLLFDGHFFAQVIEGPVDAIASIRARTMHDPRQELAMVGQEVAIAQRQFSDWAMRVVDTRPAPLVTGVEQRLGTADIRIHPELLAFFRTAARDT